MSGQESEQTSETGPGENPAVPDEAPVEETVADSTVDDGTVLVDDGTVVVSRAAPDADAGVDDATRVVTRASAERAAADDEEWDAAEVEDLTMVVARPPQSEGGGSGARDSADDEPVEELTVVAAHLTPPPSDDTLASGSRDASRSGSISMDGSVPSNAGARSASFADYMRSGSVGTGTTGSGLDPERRIAQVPDRMPWEVVPEAEAGVHQDLPVVYGPRDLRERGADPSLDAVHRVLGPAPAAAFVPVHQGREALPSLQRRERKARTLTLIVYGVVVAAALAGLCGVAVLAFA